ncbi:class I SAM-dependent methyltransferase [Legionella sp. CNM-4043-24]|uniref:class I SAM-dependent methyltransferase n=1 Tax=Legionella sp. CNM-4043-24 TaxID=3421646 RepID=UPI00403ADF36
MPNQEWPANDYAIGSFIQASIANQHLNAVHCRPTDRVLDIGCGNGAYTRNILNLVPDGSVLGIDPSENMLKLAHEIIQEYPGFSIKKDDVLSMNFQSEFDYAVSFWCLQWVNNIVEAFANIVNALKPGGRFFTLFPVGDDPFIMGYYALRDARKIRSLDHFTPPMDYTRLDNLADKLKSIPCKQLKVEKQRHSLILPSLDVYRKFVNGIAFFQTQLPDSEVKQLNDAMVEQFDAECKRLYRGEYQFNLSVYLVSGEK